MNKTAIRLLTCNNLYILNTSGWGEALWEKGVICLRTQHSSLAGLLNQEPNALTMRPKHLTIALHICLVLGLGFQFLAKISPFLDSVESDVFLSFSHLGFSFSLAITHPNFVQRLCSQRTFWIAMSVLQFWKIFFLSGFALYTRLQCPQPS